MTRRVLLVDDDELFARVVRDRLVKDGITVEIAPDAATAEALAEQGFPVAVIDGRLPDGRGMALVESFGARKLVEKFVIVTGFPEVGDAIAALRCGIVDFLTKPVDLEQLRLAVLSALRIADLERASQRAARTENEERTRISGALPAMSDDLRTQLGRAATSGATLLILGETGTGKTALARTVHLLGGESRPFVATNCAAIPDELLESELFGSDKGGFTGATARPGLFELADGGTLFLDEIGELSLRGQAKVLSVVEDGLVRRIGAATSRRVTVRLIAATNRPLEELVRAGTFREDLYYRLSVLAFRLPPLRERTAELLELVQSLLRDLRAGPKRVLAEGELERLAAHPFLGNLRELRNVLERAVILGGDGPLEPSRYLLGSLAPTAAPSTAGKTASAASAASATTTRILTLEEVERRHITDTLAACGGNRTQAAAALGIGIATLRRHLARPGEPGSA